MDDESGFVSACSDFYDETIGTRIRAFQLKYLVLPVSSLTGNHLKKISSINFIILKKISSASWRKSFLMVCISLGFILTFQGCKDEEEVGLNVLPPDDQLYTDFSDTATVLTRIVEEDSIRTDELSLQLFGSDQ